MKGQRQPEIHRRLVERVIIGMVIVRLLGVAGHHDAAKAHLLGLAQFRDAPLDRGHGQLRHAKQAVGRGLAISLQPAVIGRHAGLLVFEIGVIAQNHANRGIDDFGTDAIEILVRRAQCPVPATAVQFIEFSAAHAQGARILAGRGHQTDGNGFFHAFDDIDIAVLFIVDQMRRTITKAGIDMVNITIGWLGNM